jgi:uncharacterized protein YegL
MGGSSPPNHYALLGLPHYEKDLGRIRSQYLQVYEEARRYQVGHYSDAAVAFLEELSHAYQCLMDPQSKQLYDDQLRQQAAPLSAGQTTGTAVPLRPDNSSIQQLGRAMEQIPFGFGTNDFAENPEPRVPCVLVLDVSASMAGKPISELNQGLAAYRDELRSDSLAAKRVEVAIVTFGGDVKAVSDFTTAEHFHAPVLEPSGMTPMGQAVNRAIDMLEERKQQYRAHGIAYYRPWLFLITDGEPNDPGWERAAERAVLGEKSKSFALFAVGVEGANFAVLQRFCGSREPLRLNGLHFRKLFQWLSSSQRSVSRSTPGDEVPLENPTAPNGWASIV